MNTSIQRSCKWKGSFRRPEYVGEGWGRWVQVRARGANRQAVWIFVDAVIEIDDPRLLIE